MESPPAKRAKNQVEVESPPVKRAKNQVDQGDANQDDLLRLPTGASIISICAATKSASTLLLRQWEEDDYKKVRGGGGGRKIFRPPVFLNLISHIGILPDAAMERPNQVPLLLRVHVLSWKSPPGLPIFQIK